MTEIEGIEDSHFRESAISTYYTSPEILVLLGRDSRFSGNLFFQGYARIEGTFEGKIEGQGVLIVGDNASIKGEIFVDSCILLSGNIDATILATQSIEVHLDAKAKGKLRAPSIFIDRGVEFEGICEMGPVSFMKQMEQQNEK